MNCIRPDGIAYIGRYKVRLDPVSGLWLVIHRPSDSLESTHATRGEAIAAANDKATRRKASGPCPSKR